MRKPKYPRLLPLLMVGSGVLCLTKASALWAALSGSAVSPNQLALIQPAAASSPTPARSAPVQPSQAALLSAPTPVAVPIAIPAAPDPVQAAEREVLESLRGRRTALEEREQGLSAREAVLAAAERRLTARLDEMAALQGRLQDLDRARGEREEAGWRGLVKTYETMKPRDAASVFDDLDMPTLVQIVDRMREARAAPVLGAMRPDRARQLTTELAQLRARKID